MQRLARVSLAAAVLVGKKILGLVGPHSFISSIDFTTMAEENHEPSG